jgi:propanol-preferring alcohol dehydrogenase
MKAARLQDYGKAPALEDVPVPDILGRSDWSRSKHAACADPMSNSWTAIFRKYADIPRPIMMGHEITGVVHAIGNVVPQRVD